MKQKLKILMSLAALGLFSGCEQKATKTTFKSDKSLFFYLEDIRGFAWNIRKEDVTKITPDFTDTNIVRIWLSDGMTICIPASNRTVVAERIWGH